MLLVCAFFIDRIGRRNWTVAAFVAGGVLLAVLASASQQCGVGDRAGHAELRHHRLVQRRLYLYTPEIYPTRMRAIGTGLATSWLRLASAVGPATRGIHGR